MRFIRVSFQIKMCDVMEYIYAQRTSAKKKEEEEEETRNIFNIRSVTITIHTDTQLLACIASVWIWCFFFILLYTLSCSTLLLHRESERLHCKKGVFGMEADMSWNVIQSDQMIFSLSLSLTFCLFFCISSFPWKPFPNEWKLLHVYLLHIMHIFVT